MKPNRLIIGLLILLVTAMSCTKDEDSDPVIKGYLNGTEVKEIKITKGTTFTFKYEVAASSNLTKVEVFVRRGIGLLTDTQLFLRKESVTGDLEGNTFSVEGTLTATTDVMVSIGAIDSEGNISVLQLNAIMDISEFADLSMGDAKADGTSKSFCNAQYGLNLFIANARADLNGIDFGFAYFEADVAAKACLISFNEYSKVGTYAINNATNVTTFKKATSYTYTKAADLEAAFNGGTAYAALTGYTAGLVASNIQLNDVIAFKTQAGKYGLIQVTGLDRKTESALNEQTIKYNLVVQK